MWGTTAQPEREKLDEVEKKSFDYSAEFQKLGSAYAQEHGTRPSTIGHVLSSSPLALLSW
jgi:hypothetical protein